jgi:Raf kinase inhibitor-like YbhB/YbcL family protein
VTIRSPAPSAAVGAYRAGVPWSRVGTAVLLRALALPVIAMACAGCTGDDDQASAPTDTSASTSAPGSITVTSPAFADGAPIPEEFTCRGAGSSPPLAWTGLPAGTQSVALVVLDPDAPSGTFVHWVLFAMPPTQQELATGTSPPGTMQALNSAGDRGWTPPCPPSGTHHYRFTVYALGEPPDVLDGADPETAISAIEAAAIAQGTLTGLVSAG